MSASPELELDLDLHFLPAWAQQSPAVNRFAKYEGGEERGSQRRDDRSNRFGGGERRGPRPPYQPRREKTPQDQRRAGGERPGAPRQEGSQPGQGENFRQNRFRHDDARPPGPPLPEVNVNFLPEEKAVELLARQIKLTGRAYPLFEIGQLVLKKPDRFHAQFTVVKNPEGQAAQPLWVCNLDESLWLSEQDAIHHVLKRHFDTFYQKEKIATEAPKGTYTFVAQCGLSGVVLGPPNYHDYQTKLHKLHADRFARMPFEVYKSRVKIVRDEAIVKQWVEGQSFKLEYHCLNVPEPKKLASMEEVGKHFRETHLANIIKSVDSFTPATPSARELLPAPLKTLAYQALEDQKRFPLRIATVLSQQFASHGLQFFKVNKTFTHVSVARPHYLDLNANPVSENVRRIVEMINATPKCTRRRLLEALVPAPTPPAAPAPTEAISAVDTLAPTPELTALIADLHWLIHQGHVIEFANGIIETAKQPLLKPIKPKAEAPRAAANEAGGQSAAMSGVADAPGQMKSGSAALESVAASQTAMPSQLEPVTQQTPTLAETPEPAEPAGRPSMTIP